MPPRLSTEDVLRRLVAFDSTSRNSNLPIANWICDYLDRPGVRVDRNLSPDGGKVNLVITLGPAQDRQVRAGLVLSGHMDVVPAEEAEWRSDPFTLVEVDGAYVGRGACDMKGFLAAALNVATAVDPARLRHPLVLILTYDEEVGTLGAKHLVETWPGTATLPRSTVVGEPTSLRVVRMHKGHLTLRVTLRGRSAHSGYPHLGVNAIEPAGRAIVALAALRRSLEGERPASAEQFAEVPFPALSVTQVRGGVATNVIPDCCVLDISARLLPGMESGAVVERVRDALQGALGATAFDLAVTGNSPAMMLPEAAAIHDMVRRELGQRDTASVSFATDAGWLGTVGLECVIFGPGSIEAAHKPNEFVPASELARAEEIVGRLVRRCCVAAA